MSLVPDMAQEQEYRTSTTLPKCDTYFETIQSRKKLPLSLQETLTDAFAKIPVSSFPAVPSGKGKEGLTIKKHSFHHCYLMHLIPSWPKTLTCKILW